MGADQPQQGAFAALPYWQIFQGEHTLAIPVSHFTGKQKNLSIRDK